jgi:MFS family permease
MSASGSEGTSAATAVRPTPPLARRFAFGAMLSVTMATGTFPGYAFGVLGPDIIREFSLSRFEFGLMTTVFFLVGGSLSLAAGPLVDRFGAKRVMLTSFVILGSAILGMAAAPAHGVLLAFAALAGLGLAAGNPVTNKLIAENIPPGRRGLTMGSKQAGVPVGAFLTGAILAPLAVAIGWREAFAWSAAIPLAAIVVAVLLIPRDAPPSRAARTAAGGRLDPAVRLLAVYAFLMGSGVAVIQAYLPLYLVEAADATTAEAGLVVAAVGFAGIVSRVAGGWGGERLRSFSLPLAIFGGGGGVAILLVLAVEHVGLWLAFPAAILFASFALAWNSVGMLAVLQIAGARHAGRASGIVLFGFYGGYVASPVIFGWLVDRLGSYGLPWLAVAATFGVAAAVGFAWRGRERAIVPGGASAA